MRPYPLLRPLPLLICVFLAGSVPANAAQVDSAQVNAAQVRAAQSAPQPAQSNALAGRSTQLPVVRTTSNMVLVDVVVASHDHPVHGLACSQFRIFDNGRPQTIVSFEEHAPAPQPTTSSFTPPTLPPDTYTNLPLTPSEPAFNVLLLDGLNTTLADRLQARRQMLLYLKSIRPGTPLAIFTLSSSLRMIAGFTTNAAALGRAVQRQSSLRQNAINDPDTTADLDTALGDFANMGGDADVLGIVRQFETDLTSFDTDDRVRLTLDAMQQLARYLSAIPGRKNLIWFSGSFPISLDADDSQRQPFMAMRDYADLVRNTDALLAAARVAVYPVDARALLTLPVLDVTSTASTNLVSANVNGGRNPRHMTTANRPNRGQDEMNDLKELMKEQASMEQIAQETGGQSYLNTNALSAAIADAVENGSSYYTLGYVPAAKTLDGKFHSLRVSTPLADAKLAYRSGYVADASPSSAQSAGQNSLILAAMLRGAPPATQILFDARVLPSTDSRVRNANLPSGPSGEMAAGLKAPTRRAVIDLKVDTRTLLFRQSLDGEFHARAEFVLVAYSPDGTRVNYLDRGFQVNLNAQQLALARAKGFSVRFTLDVPSTPVTLRIAVHDLDAARIGSLEIPFPAQRAPSPRLRPGPGT